MDTMTKNQTVTLKTIANTKGALRADDYDRRTINALVRRGFVAVKTTKKGDTVVATARGRKALN